MKQTIADILAIGAGPFHLGLGALAQKTSLQVVTLEQRSHFRWHEGLLFPNATLQVPFLADLVSMVDPTHPLSFLNYLHVHNRLYAFYFREEVHPLRAEYDDYCRWASEQIPNIHWNSRALDVEKCVENGQECFRVQSENTQSGQVQTHLARHLSVGVGTSPHVPKALRAALGPRVFHSASYLSHKETLAPLRHVTVVGSGQSAAECVLDLLQDPSREVLWLTQSPGFYPMEYSRLGLEHFTPDYTRHFYSLPKAKKAELLKKQSLLYKGIDFDTIADVQESLYIRAVQRQGSAGACLLSSTSLLGISASEGGFSLLMEHQDTGQRATATTQAVVLATGYTDTPKNFLAGLREHIQWDESLEVPVADAHWNAAKPGSQGAVYVQNAEMKTHGVGAPDLGLGAHRNASILNRVAGREIFTLHPFSAFQTFGIPVHLQQK